MVSNVSTTFPSIDINKVGQTAWNDANQNFIGHLVYPATQLASARGNLFRFDSTDDQLITQQTRGNDVAPTLNGDLIAVPYHMSNFRRRYFVDPDKVDDMPANFKNLERQTGSMYTARSTALAHESAAATALFDAAVWNSQTPSVVWSTSATAVPIDDLMDMAALMVTERGIMPNTVVMGAQNYFNFAKSSQVLNRLPDVSFRAITRSEALGALKGGGLENLENIYVGLTSYTSSNPTATEVRADLWGNFVWLGYIDPNPVGDTVNSATIGAELAGKAGVRMREYNDPNLDPDSLYIESQAKRDHVNLDPGLGQLLTSVSA